ncbi:hypothetical protein B0J14DRAFT_671021 [Halenospora varia]|nr:hypothetical protein B0J14DRAFT_671021 [Halenospora varia]
MKLLAIATGIALLASSALGVAASAMPEGASMSATRAEEQGMTLGSIRYTGTINGIDFCTSGTAEEVTADFVIFQDLGCFREGTSSRGCRTCRQFNHRRSPATCCLEQDSNPVTPQTPPHCCNQDGWPDWPSAEYNPVIDGIAYLNRIGGTCHVDARNYARISCSYDSAIKLWNDNYFPIDPSCVYLASYAQDITNSCVTWHKYINGWRRFSCGQQFDTDSYNIVVEGDSC